jgi:uncharacterized coiled-coil DUF342 family protein
MGKGADKQKRATSGYKLRWANELLEKQKSKYKSKICDLKQYHQDFLDSLLRVYLKMNKTKKEFQELKQSILSYMEEQKLEREMWIEFEKIDYYITKEGFDFETAKWIVGG